MYQQETCPPLDAPSGCFTCHCPRSWNDAWGDFRFLGYKFGRVARGDNWIGG
jgi:hypothetical protein